MQYNFEWDPEKAERNLRKHGVGFEQAVSVFCDPRALSIFDEKHSKSGDRWITLGLSSSGSLLVVNHTFEVLNKLITRIRIFSSRKATEQEKQQYME